MAGLWVEVADLDDTVAESEFAEDACRAASYVMWALSGRRYFGVTTVTERYVRYAPLVDTRLIHEASLVYSNIDETLPFTEPWAGNETRIRLRGQPVSRIHTVRTADGTIISPDNYYLADRSTLFFVKQTLILPADIEITYTYGAPPPALGKMAARRLATEFTKLWSGDSCNLPSRVTSINRQGVSYTLLDPQDFLDNGRTGIYDVDLFLKAANPAKALKRSKVFSPDLPATRRHQTREARFAASNRDITVTKTGGSVTFTLASVSGEFLEGAGWTPLVVVRSWGASRFSELPTSAAEISAGEITVTISYAQAFEAVRMDLIGTWDLYGVDGTGAATYVASGNLTVNMSA